MSTAQSCFNTKAALSSALQPAKSDAVSLRLHWRALCMWCSVLCTHENTRAAHHNLAHGGVPAVAVAGSVVSKCPWHQQGCLHHLHIQDPVAISSTIVCSLCHNPSEVCVQLEPAPSLKWEHQTKGVRAAQQSLLHQQCDRA